MSPLSPLSLLRFHPAGGLVLTALLAGCNADAKTMAPQAKDPSTVTPAFTAASGSVSTLLGRATFGDPSDHNFKVKRATHHWNFEIKANPALSGMTMLREFRLSVSPVKPDEWSTILKMAGA